MVKAGGCGGEGWGGAGEGNSQHLACQIPGKGGARRKRTTYTKKQLEILLEAFQDNAYPGITIREYLSSLAEVAESRIQVWFQNRRARQLRPSNKENHALSEQRPAQHCYPHASVFSDQENQQQPRQEGRQGESLVSAQDSHQGEHVVDLLTVQESSCYSFNGQESRTMFHMKETFKAASGWGTTDYSPSEMPNKQPGGHLDGSLQRWYHCSQSSSKLSVPVKPAEVQQRGEPFDHVESPYGVAYYAPPALQQRAAPFNLQNGEQREQSSNHQTNRQGVSSYSVQERLHSGAPVCLSQMQPTVLPYAFPQNQHRVPPFHDSWQGVAPFDLNWQGASLPTPDYQPQSDVLGSPSDINQTYYHYNSQDCLPRVSGWSAADMIQMVSQESRQREFALIPHNNTTSVSHLISPDSLHGELNFSPRDTCLRPPYLTPEGSFSSVCSGSPQSSLYSQSNYSPQGHLTPVAHSPEDSLTIMAQLSLQETDQSMSHQSPQDSPHFVHCLSPEDNLLSRQNHQQQWSPLLVQDTHPSEFHFASQAGLPEMFSNDLQDFIYEATHSTPQDFTQGAPHPDPQNIHLSGIPLAVEDTPPSSSAANLLHCHLAAAGTPSNEWSHLLKRRSEWLVETAHGGPSIQATGEVKLDDLLDDMLTKPFGSSSGFH